MRITDAMDEVVSRLELVASRLEAAEVGCVASRKLLWPTYAHGDDLCTAHVYELLISILMIPT